MEPTTPPPSPSPSAVTILGKYQLLRLLGRGSFAKVYQAKSLADDSTVAVKIIHKSKIDPPMQPRILREVDAMRRIHHHPNILKIHEVLATKTKIYLIVEFAAGGELFNKITRKGKLTEPIARKYFQQLVSALCFCHKNGVIHRDLKPQNLLLDHDGNLKVSDFGLSALPEQLKNGLLHTACGTPAYTAPEILFRRGYDGSKADAWSCGLILFVLLAGYLPFSDANISEMCRKISRRDYKFPDWISKPARFVIHRLLDPNPNNRMSLECLYQNSWFKKSIKARPNESLFGPGQAQPAESLFGPGQAQPAESLFGPGQAWPSGRLSGPGQPAEGCGRIERMGSGVNAFDIISMSSGLDLTGLFETTSGCRREKRFMSKASIVVVEEKVKEVGGILGFKVEIGKDGVIGLGKGKVVIVVEVFEIVADELLMVSVKVMNGGFEFDELHWGDWKSGLQDVVLSWHNELV